MQRIPNDSEYRTNNATTDADKIKDALNSAEQNASKQNAYSADRQSNRAASMRTGTSGRAATPAKSSGIYSASQRPSRQPQRSAAPGSRSPERRSAASDGRRPATSRPAQPRPSGARPADASRRPSSARPAQTRSASAQRRPAGQARPASRSYAPASRRPARPVKKKSGFKKILIIYSAILLIILIVGLLIFNSFIGNYEKNQPVNIAKNVSIALSEDPSAFLNEHKDMIASMADTDEVISKYTDLVSGKEISYIENSASRAEAPSFDLRIDGSTVGTLTLESDGKGSFGLNTWKLASLDIAKYLPDTYSYTILAPTGYTVSINGNDLPESNITATDETPEILTNAGQFIKEVPKYDSYTVAGLLSIPTVTAKDSSGSEVGVAAAQEYFVAGGEPSKEFIDEQKDFVEDALESWAYHFINYNQGKNLANYVQSGSDLYAYIFGSDTMDPIYTAFYDWEYITNVDFTEFEAKNYIQYADDCYSVDVKYKLQVDFSNANLSDDGQMLDATWVIVHNKGYWGIADVIYHQGSESSLADAAEQKNNSSETAEEVKDDSEDAAADEETTVAEEEETTVADEEETVEETE